MVLFHGIVELQPRMVMLMLTVELYMQLTNRNMPAWHTATSLMQLKLTHIRWQREVKRILVGLRALVSMKLKPTKITTELNLPKIHDIQHIIAKTSERGPAQFHSAEG